ncbi:MAG: hypothetical protein ACKOQ4_00125 [Mycobacterium sp.]
MPPGAAAEPPRRALTRPSARADDDPEPADDSDDAVESEPVDPPDPVVSANAAGIAATAEPTPRATAKAPTRPTYRA